VVVGSVDLVCREQHLLLGTGHALYLYIAQVLVPRAVGGQIPSPVAPGAIEDLVPALLEVTPYGRHGAALTLLVVRPIAEASPAQAIEGDGLFGVGRLVGPQDPFQAGVLLFGQVGGVGHLLGPQDLTTAQYRVVLDHLGRDGFVEQGEVSENPV